MAGMYPPNLYTFSCFVAICGYPLVFWVATQGLPSRLWPLPRGPLGYPLQAGVATLPVDPCAGKGGGPAWRLSLSGYPVFIA